MNMKDMILSLTGDTFSGLKNDFDKVLNRTIGNMEMKGANEATITLKVGITLDKKRVETPEGVKDITNPVFKHDVSSVMQVKDKMTGQMRGDYSLEWDADEERFVLRKVDNGQTSFDDGDFDFFEAEYEVVNEDTDIKMIEGEVTDADTDKQPTPFDWLSEFIGSEMNITEAMGNYTVRTLDNAVVLSSATSPDNVFHCPADKLKDHVGHQIICVGYGADEIESISIECEDCNEVLYELASESAAPEVEELEIEDYEYEEPEEEYELPRINGGRHENTN